MSTLAVSDVVWQAAIGAVLTAVLAWIGRQAQIAAEKAAENVEAVKEKLDESTTHTKKQLDSIEKTGERTEKYCNSAMLRALKLVAATARAKADDSKNAVDLAAADLAEAEVAAHEKTVREIAAKEDRENTGRPVQPAGTPLTSGSREAATEKLHEAQENIDDAKKVIREPERPQDRPAD